MQCKICKGDYRFKIYIRLTMRMMSFTQSYLLKNFFMLATTILLML